MRAAVATLGQFLVGKAETATVTKRLTHAAGGLIGLRIIFSGLSFLVALLLARVLGPQNLGVYSYAFAWILLLCIPASLGIDQILVRAVAGHLAKAEWHLLSGLLRRPNKLILLASLTISSVGALVAWMLRAHSAPGVLQTFWIALLLVPLIALTRVRQCTMQGLHKVVQGSIPEQVIQPLLLLAFLLILHFWASRLLTAPFAMFLNVLAAAIAFQIGAALLRRSLPPQVIQARPVYRDLNLVRSGLPLIFLASSGIIFAQADTLILGTLKGAAAVGIYSIAHKGADLAAFILTAQNAALASTAAALHASGEKERLQRLVTRLTRFTVLATIPIALVTTIFGHWFLLLYGPSFTIARTALMILSIGQLVNVVTGSAGILLTMTGNERDAAAAIATGAVTNVVLNLVLVPRWGADGAAVGYAVSMILWNVWMVVALRRRVGIDSTALGLFGFSGRDV